MSRHVDIASYTVANSKALQYQQPQSMSSRHGGVGRQRSAPKHAAASAVRGPRSPEDRRQGKASSSGRAAKPSAGGDRGPRRVDWGPPARRHAVATGDRTAPRRGGQPAQALVEGEPATVTPVGYSPALSSARTKSPVSVRVFTHRATSRSVALPRGPAPNRGEEECSVPPQFAPPLCCVLLIYFLLQAPV